jgi:metal-responsive CopG/Arc/MetJ family transcriptional regulator
MVPDQDDEELVAVEAELPQELLVEIDRLAVLHGYETPSAVVQEALERQ